MKRKVINSLICFVLFCALFIYCSLDWSLKNFTFDSFEQILYTLTSSVGDASKDLIFSFVKSNVLIPLGILLVVIIICFNINYYIKNYATVVKLQLFSKHFSFNLFKNKVVTIFSYILKCIPLILLIHSVYLIGDKFYFWDYLKNQSQRSTFIEAQYVDPESVEISFPEEKQNLIYIYLESMESTFSDVESGGGYNRNYIPELTQIAEEYTNFSNTEALGGGYKLTGATWTVAAMIAHTSGIPLKFLYGHNIEYEQYDEFIPGAYSLGEVLEKEGYKNYVMFGSEASFGGREKYFRQHGNYHIYDYLTAKEDGIIEDDYYVFWGFEDEILFEYAKKELLEISQNDEPFNFSLLTVDTHFPDGYLSDFCAQEDANPYLNSISCSSKQTAEFISWIQEQDFYENTTIVIVGDHLSMNSYSFDELDPDYDRTVYNTFINAKAETENTKNRVFTLVDFYPTTLAALGAEIEGERLGLGTNLYGDKETLAEEFGVDYINEEMEKVSTYYVKCIHSEDCEK